MEATTISELANWDGHLDQKRQTPKWPRSSSLRARDTYQTSLDFDGSQPSSARLSRKKRAEKSSLDSNLARVSAPSASTNARLANRVDTASAPFHNVDDDHHRSTPHTPPRPILPSSPFTTWSISSQSSPILSVPLSRVNNSRNLPSLGYVASSQPTSTLESDVIDLTLEDTEGEPVNKELIANTAHPNNRPVDPAPHHLSISSAPGSPILPEQSLFTPPPPRRRRPRLFLDYLQVPPLPNGLTKGNYQPISPHHEAPLQSSALVLMPGSDSLSESQTAGEHSRSPQRCRDEERDRDVGASSHANHRSHVPVVGADVTPSELLDVFYEPTEVPLHDDDTYPPLTAFDLAINTRFQFAHTWRAHASKLREAELDWTQNPRVLRQASVLIRSSDTSSPRIPGTTGYVSIGHLRPWELVVPKESTEQTSVGNAHERETPAGVDPDRVLPPDDALPTPDAVAALALSNSAVSLPFSSVVDTETDMDQYFNGLGDSPNKDFSSRQQLVPTNTFHSHLLHPAGRSDVDSFDFGLPFLALEPRALDTSAQECFLQAPSSPTTAGISPPIAPAPASDPPIGPTSYIIPSTSNAPAADGPLAEAWSFEQECPLDDKSHPGPDVPPTAPGTINPSLLGPEQPETPTMEPERTQKRRSKLPEPIIYIRRPMDPSALPIIAGKRPVQIKYRDSGVSSTSPSTRKPSNELSSNRAENPTGSTGSDTDGSVPAKRRPVPSRKLREAYTASESESESESDFVPDTSQSKIKRKVKRPGSRDKETIPRYQEVKNGTVPAASFCHQCRNTSVRPKMMCSNQLEGRVCGKRFCNRCVLYRYPDITFDENSAGFLCPVCTNTCNCSHCSRSRGEEFISMRLGGLAASIFKSKMTLVRDASKLPHHDSPPDKSTQQDTTPVQPGEPKKPQFWAHVYGMKGEHVGSAFMTRDQMERLHAPSASTSISAPPILTLPEEQSQSQPQPRQDVQKPKRREKKRKRPTGPRIFIGQPRASWKIRAVRDLEPSADMNVDENAGETATGKGKGRARRPRWYIGNSAALFEPYGRMPGSGISTPMSVSSRCSTPGAHSDRSLSPAADDWPQPQVGEGCEWAPRGVGVGMGTVDGHGASNGPFPGQGGVGQEATTDIAHADAGSASLSNQDVERAIGAVLAHANLDLSVIYP